MSTFGRIYKITTFGESHCPQVGVTIENFPPKFKLDVSLIQKQLDRRRPGQSKITTQRKENDNVEILSGVFNRMTTGSPFDHARTQSGITLSFAQSPPPITFPARAVAIHGPPSLKKDFI